MVFCVVIVSLTGAYWLPSIEISKTGLAALLSIANLVFLTQKSGYFSPEPELNPLLHTWSLGVEEQIYLVFPLVFLTILRLSRRTRNVVVVVLAIAMGSFLLELWLSWGPQELFGFEPRLVAFYFPGTRIWEFLVGATLAVLLPATSHKRLHELLWIAVIVAVFVFLTFTIDNGSVFPGWVAIIPVGATAATIVLGNSPDSLVHTFLGKRSILGRLMGWLGDRSYGWYLWHWPVLLAVNQMTSAQVGRIGDLIAVVAALVPAHLSYIHVEQRWRGSIQLPKLRRRVGGVLLVATLLIVSVSAAGVLSIVNPATETWAEDQWLLGNCRVAEEDCIDSGAFESQTVFLVGDSHAGALAHVLRDITDQLNVPLVVSARVGCPFVNADWGFFIDNFQEANRSTNHYCRDHYQKVLAMIDKTPKPIVVMADYASLYAGSRSMTPQFDLRVVCPILESGECQAPNNQRSRQTFFLESISESLHQILRREGRVVFVGAVPVMYRDQSAMESNRDRRGTSRVISEAIVGTSDKFRQNLSHAVPLGRVSSIDLHQILCSDEFCPFSRGKTSFFTTSVSANDHLSLRGALEIRSDLRSVLLRHLD